MRRSSLNNHHPHWDYNNYNNENHHLSHSTTNSISSNISNSSSIIRGSSSRRIVPIVGAVPQPLLPPITTSSQPEAMYVENQFDDDDDDDDDIMETNSIAHPYTTAIDNTTHNNNNHPIKEEYDPPNDNNIEQVMQDDNDNNNIEIVTFNAGSEFNQMGLLSPLPPTTTNQNTLHSSLPIPADAVTIYSAEDNSTIQSYSSFPSTMTSSALNSWANNNESMRYDDREKQQQQPSSPSPQGREYFQEPFRIKRPFSDIMTNPPFLSQAPLEESQPLATVEAVMIPHDQTEMSLLPSSRIITDDVSGLSSLSEIMNRNSTTIDHHNGTLPPTATATAPIQSTKSVFHQFFHPNEPMTVYPPFPLPNDDNNNNNNNNRLLSLPQPDHQPSHQSGTVPQTRNNNRTEQPQQQPQRMSSILVPKAQLHLLYGQPPRRKVISNSHYHCWPDSNPTHIQQWTAILVCPMTGELFLAGRCPLYDAVAITLSDPHHRTTTNTTTFWFSKKINAEHAAAARAYDCLIFRDRHGVNTSSTTTAAVDRIESIGMEQPYLEPIYNIPELMVIPYEIRENIIRQQAEIRRIGGLPTV